MICPVCKGNGYINDKIYGHSLKCLKCNGLGTYSAIFECYECGNKIKDFDFVDDGCPYCKGTEFMEKQTVIKL